MGRQMVHVERDRERRVRSLAIRKIVREGQLALCVGRCASQHGIPLVLDVISGAARDLLSDLGPAVSIDFMGTLDRDPLLRRQAILLDVRIQLVAPALAALLRKATTQVTGDVTPVFGSVSLYKLCKACVLLLIPSNVCKKPSPREGS